MRTLAICLAILLLAFTAHAYGDRRQRGKSSRSLSKFNAPGRISKQRAVMLDEQNEHFLNAIQTYFGDEISSRDLEGVYKRAIMDPLCTAINCTNTDNRNFVDGIEYQTLNGQCNNVGNFSWGMAGVQHVRLLPHAYQNDRWNIRAFSEKQGTNREPLPNPRNISNVVHKTSTDKADSSDSCTLALFYFMQFIDHDVVKTPEGRVGNDVDCCTNPRGFCLPLEITESNDEVFPQGHCMDLRRSDTVFMCDDVEGNGFQNQYNEITAYLDASMVYGSSVEEADNLRTHIGGRMKESTEDFMPPANDTNDLPCNITYPNICFGAGDTRSNVHPGLTTYHTVFLREHNRIAKTLSKAHAEWDDTKIFMETRKIVAAEIQHIVFNEMLPAVLDTSFLTSYNLSSTYAYNSSLDASIFQAFSIAYRYHNLMPSIFHKSNIEGNNTYTAEQFEAYEKPSYLLGNHYQGIDNITLGLTHNKCPMTNGRMNDDARDKLFFNGTNDTLDLAAINIIRGREWGTPAYVQFRLLCGLGNATSWTSLNNTHTPEEIEYLQSVYLDVVDVDLWTGVVTETKVGNSLSGPTQSCLVAKQFYQLKNGDRFWFENTQYGFDATKAAEIKKVTLARILCDNLNVSVMRSDVFDSGSAWRKCNRYDEMDLTLW